MNAPDQNAPDHRGRQAREANDANDDQAGIGALRLLRLLAATTAFCRVTGGSAAVYVERGGVTLGAGRAPAAALRAIEARGLASATGERRDYRLTETGRSLAARLLSGEQPGDHAARHMTLVVQRPANGELPVLVNEAESPLLWLRRRRGRDGKALIGEAEFAAGERLRADVERARMLPRLTADWERPANPGGSGEGLSAPEAIVAAKARVDRALSAIGPEFSGLLLDVCGFLKPIERIELERGWPARSAKVVLGLALARLARHYGYANETQGPARVRVRRWVAEGDASTFPVDGAGK